MIDEVAFFVKFLDKERVHSFVNEGVIFMNSLKYFKEHEEQEVRGDKKEGTSYIFSGDNTKFKVEGNNIGGVIDGNIQYRFEESINVFCMTAIKDSHIKNIKSHDLLKFNASFTKFGNSAVIIPRKNIPIFINRVKASFQKNSYLHQVPGELQWAGSVEYVNDCFSGKYGPFKKNIFHAWQSEWRIAFLRGAKFLKPKPYKFKIGSILDISLELPTDELINKGVRIN